MKNPFMTPREIAALRESTADSTGDYLHYYLPNGIEDALLDVRAYEDGSATLRIVIGDFELGAAHSTSVYVTIPSLKHFRRAVAKWKPLQKVK